MTGRSGRWALLHLAAAATFAWLAGAPSAASAGSEADRVRAAIEEALGRYPWPVEVEGDVVVVERDGALHILFPGVVVEAESGSGLDVGDVEAVAVSRPDGRYDVRLTLPSTMLQRDENGATTAHLLVGEQRFEGVWAPEFEAFVQIDAGYRDIRLTAPGGPVKMTLGSATMTVDYQETAPGLLSGSSLFRLGDLEVAGDGGAGRLTVGSFEMRGHGEGMRFAELTHLAREMNAAVQRAGEAESTDADLLDLLQVIVTMPRVYASAWWEATITDFDVDDQSGARAFGIQQAHLRGAIAGLDRERSRVEFRYEHRGLDVADPGGAVGRFVPRRMIFDVAAADLPNETLWRALAEYVETLADADPESAAALLWESMSAALLDAASELRIRSLTVDAPALGVDADGALKADPNAIYRVSGRFDATVRGLDDLVASLTPTPQDEDGMRLAMALAMLQALGAGEVDAAGAPIRRYRVEVTPGGAVLLNGNDLRAVFDALRVP